MSGSSYESICPMCKADNMSCSSDWKPFDLVSGECLECGFYYWTEEGQMTLEQVNEAREERDLEPLTELAEQKWKRGY